MTAIRTFKARRGRVTTRQQRALDELWAAYGVDAGGGLLDGAALFGRRAPLVLEIGFGMGETTAAMAAEDPDRDLLAVDVHTPGAGALLHQIGERGLTNVRVLLGDALGVLRDGLAPGSLDEVRAYFPDPWPKARHHKRRLVTPAFARLVASRLRPGGRLHCATDWAPYAEQTLAVVDAEPLLVNPYAGFAPRPPWRPVTRFERQGIAKGHEVFDVIAERT
ncbi:MAG: tRNA (guanosine(46)-N7)-methyltransferase TrmB [Actinomycetota bacterium]|nr:tRNA (guanosine(46)-N7)-methyltransferase TrmB [Actinomycetota bacterium]